MLRNLARDPLPNDLAIATRLFQLDQLRIHRHLEVSRGLLHMLTARNQSQMLEARLERRDWRWALRLRLVRRWPNPRQVVRLERRVQVDHAPRLVVGQFPLAGLPDRLNVRLGGREDEVVVRDVHAFVAPSHVLAGVVEGEHRCGQVLGEHFFVARLDADLDERVLLLALGGLARLLLVAAAFHGLLGGPAADEAEVDGCRV